MTRETPNQNFDPSCLSAVPVISDALVRDIVDRCGFGLLVTDPHGNIVYANRRLCEDSGYPLEELLGRNSRLFQSGQTSPYLYRELWATVLDGRTWRGDLLNRRKNGDLALEHLDISAVVDSEGRITHFLALVEKTVHAILPEPAEPQRAKNIPGTRGSPDRDAFVEKLDEMLLRSQDDGSGLSLFDLAIDGFQSIGQTPGPSGGKQPLQEIITRISSAVRADDLIASCGTGKIAIILKGTLDKNICAETAGRILQRLTPPIDMAGAGTGISGSIGIARYPLDAGNALDLLKAAAMAQAEACKDNACRYHFAIVDAA